VTADYWTAVVLVAAGTLAFRTAFLGLSRTPALPGPAKRALDHVPAAVLAALVLPGFVNPAAQDWAALAALGAGVLAALATRRDWLAIVAGLAVYWIISRGGP
jgi:branched-subunit amino acid transport protein